MYLVCIIMSRKLEIILVVTILLFVGFCGCNENREFSSDDVFDEVIPLSINSFKFIPNEIKIGETASLSWNVTGAFSLFIDNGIGIVNFIGERIITPVQTSNYTIVAWNSTMTLTTTAQIVVIDYYESDEDNETGEYGWRFVRRFSGTGRTTTDVFHIDSDIKWKVEWKIFSEIPDYIVFYNESTSPPPSPYFELRVMMANTLHSVAFVRSEEWSDLGIVDIDKVYSHSYYLDIDARNIGSWMIDVYDWVN